MKPDLSSPARPCYSAANMFRKPIDEKSANELDQELKEKVAEHSPVIMALE